MFDRAASAAHHNCSARRPCRAWRLGYPAPGHGCPICNCRGWAQHGALTTRIGETCQFDLFAKPNDGKTVQMPQWQALPAETRRSVTKLMVRLILDHVDSDRTSRTGGGAS